MKKKTRHQMYAKPNKNKVMGKMMHDMDDMDMDDMDMDEMNHMEEEEMGEYPMTSQKQCGCSKVMDLPCHTHECGEVPEYTILAHAYVPWQCYEKAFSPAEALMKGTLFPELWGVYRIPK